MYLQSQYFTKHVICLLNIIIDLLIIIIDLQSQLLTKHVIYLLNIIIDLLTIIIDLQSQLLTKHVIYLLNIIIDLLTIIICLLLKHDHIYEPRHEISNNMVSATSKGSDQRAHTRRLIRAFASCLNIL